jgi:teichuronic acid biosynthesis glycosyltransferase TuaG
MDYEVRVTVVMPTFNAAQSVENSIQSVLRQTFQDIELVVVDDCSTDHTAALVAALADKHDNVRLIKSQVNSGSPATPRNIAIENARGRYIAFLDADDSWAPEKIERQVQLMESKGAAISCTGYEVRDVEGELVGRFVPPAVAGYRDLLSENTLGCSTVMIDSEQITKPQFPICGHEDYALWLSLARQGWSVYSLPEVLATYQVTPGSVSSNKWRVLKYFWNIYRNLEGFPAIQAMFYCGRYAWNTRAKYTRADEQKS